MVYKPRQGKQPMFTSLGGTEVPSGNLTESFRMAMEIVRFPIQNVDFPYLFVSLRKSPDAVNPPIKWL